MAGPQLEDGYTKIAHEILENIGRYKFNGTQRGVIDQVWRYTYGFNRKEAELSLSFIAKAIGATKSQVDRELTALIVRNVILVTSDQPGKPRLLSFNKNYESWINERRQPKRVRPDSVLQNEDAPSSKKSTEPYSKTRTKIYNKDTFKDTLPRQQKKYAEDSTYFKMASYFHGKVKAVAEAEGLQHLIIKANLQKWADEFRKMVETDKVTDKQLIRDVMDWVAADSFWKVNVLSAKKFREKFGQLALKMKVDRPQKQQANQREEEIAKEEAFREWVRAGNDPAEFVYNP